jgi:hypothetical protein
MNNGKKEWKKSLPFSTFLFCQNQIANKQMQSPNVALFSDFYGVLDNPANEQPKILKHAFFQDFK